MIKLFRILFFKILGHKNYLKLISTVYIKLIKMGWGKSKYQELHFLKHIIKPGFSCLDIGANVGYYSVFLSKYAGISGKVFAIEPVPLFCDIWQKNTSKSKYKNLSLFPYALGEKESEVEMGTPVINGVFHHGMTKIITDSHDNYTKTFTVEMKNPNQLFSSIDKIDFIKIDVEGYESVVLGNMRDIIIKHMPLIQSELSGYENRNTVISFLKELGYSVNYLNKNKLEEASLEIIENIEKDFYFIPVIT